jgi:tetratricopeptide (TPR) repeat protein
MGNVLLEDLQREIEAGSVIAIIGVGVSVAATNNKPAASWRGLLHHGVDHCHELKSLTGVDEKWAKRVHEEIDSGDLDDMLSAAEKISRKLGAPDGGEYRRWLRETVHELKAERRDVLEALRDLQVALATTNYDGLLEEVTKLPAVTWMDGAKVERVVRGNEPGVVHLHGYWDRPESMVLGIRSYEQVLGDAHAQTMQQAIRSLKTLLFVGCREGLLDPNFGALLKWSAKVFAASEYRHFLLTRESEVTALQNQHSLGERIAVLSYGKDFDDLAPFLRGLRTGSGTKQKAQPSSPAPGQAALLPPAPRCFGREAEIEDLVSTLLATPALPVPLLGPPGIGKSAITLVVLNDPRVANRYGKRRFFIRCDSATSREMLVAEIARTAGLPVVPNLEANLLAALESAPVALAVDNAETPWEADTLRVEEFLAQLAAVPGLVLIASLRGTTRPGSVKWRQAIQPRQLPLLEARKTFLAIAGEKFASDPYLEELLGALDGIPLAITLLGYAAEGEPDLNGLWARWQQERIDILQRVGADHRLLNLEISYEISLKGPRMTVEGLGLLRVLGCLPDGADHGDLGAVYSGYGHKAAAVLRQVGLAFDEAGRLRVLTPLREYILRKHPPRPGELEPVLAHYLDLAISYGGKTGREGGAGAIIRLTTEAGNMQAMILRGLDEAQPGLAIQAALRLAEFMRFTGLGSTALLEKAVRIAQNLDSHENITANCILSLGDIALARSDHEVARQRYEEALPLYQRVGDILGQANCILSLGTIALERSDHEGARQRYEEALGLYEQIQEPYSVGWTHRLLARIARNDNERRQQVAAASAAWQSIGRDDLVESLNNEFGQP